MKFVTEWSNPRLTIPLTKFLSIFQFSDILVRRGFASQSQFLIKISEDTRIFLSFFGQMLFSFLGLMFIMVVVSRVLLAGVRISVRSRFLDGLLQAYRLFVLDLLFIPVLQLLLKLRMPCLGIGSEGYHQDFKCLGIGLERMIAIFTLFGLSIHVVFGIFFEILNFEFRFDKDARILK